MTSEETEVFEITDFTTETEWERFIARMEEIIRDWKLSSAKSFGSPKKVPNTKWSIEIVDPGEISCGRWKQISENLSFAKFQFVMTRNVLSEASSSLERDHSGDTCNDDALPYMLKDISSSDNDYPMGTHIITYWYGLRDFIVLHPAVTEDSIETEDRAKLLLSSVSIALHNTSCPIPIFVQLRSHSDKLFIGLSESNGYRTNFETIYLHHAPNQYNHLAGLVSLFKSKMRNYVFLPLQISARFKYSSQEWSLDSWPRPPIDIDDLGSNIKASELARFPLGALEEPITDLQLYTSWPYFAEGSVVENDVHSDLIPTNAPKWEMKAVLGSNTLCYVAECLRELMALSNGRTSYYSLQQLSGNVDEEETQDLAGAFDRLAAPSFPDALALMNQSRHKIRSLQQGNTPILSREITLKILHFLFPDASSDPEINNLSWMWAEDIPDTLKEKLNGLKTCPPGSLTWRLALLICHLNYSMGGLSAVAQLWGDFVQELHYRWEINCSLPCLPTGQPDLGTSLLHQKLQMFNYCIKRRTLREEQLKRDSPHSDSEDEFFECTDDLQTKKEEEPAEASPTNPEGRLAPFGDLTLLNSEEPLYIPITQEPSPLTEDCLEEQAEALLQLGTDSQGAALRAKMQSASLLSDMEAFKAANPGACLADFVRWYSPRDWIKEEGEMSSRMLVPGNMWQEVWEGARAVPVRRQRRLFDDTKEVARVLRFLGGLTPANLVSLLTPILFHAYILELAQEVPTGPPSLLPLLQTAISKMEKRNLYTDILQVLHQAELKLAGAKSLITKCLQADDNDWFEEDDRPVRDLVHKLLEKPLVEVEGAAAGQLGQTVEKFFYQLPKQHKPTDREYILRTSAGPKGSQLLPQKFYCLLSNKTFRIASAVTENIAFY